MADKLLRGTLEAGKKRFLKSNYTSRVPTLILTFLLSRVKNSSRYIPLCTLRLYQHGHPPLLPLHIQSSIFLAESAFLFSFNIAAQPVDSN